MMTKHEAERLAKLAKIERVKGLLEASNIGFEQHKNGVHIQIKTNFGLAHIWPSTNKIQVQGINYTYENHAQMISMVESLLIRPQWLAENRKDGDYEN